jgi:hypothetical protein
MWSENTQDQRSLTAWLPGKVAGQEGDFRQEPRGPAPDYERLSASSVLDGVVREEFGDHVGAHPFIVQILG